MAPPRFVIRGERIRSYADFWREIGEAVNGPSGYYGSNLDALVDCLRGGFGTPRAPFEFLWSRSSESRDALSYSETVRYLEEKLLRCHPLNRPAVQKELEAASHLQGPTLFDILVRIIDKSEFATLVLD
jgi:RNAse (barnase) inhibitor barstar